MSLLVLWRGDFSSRGATSIDMVHKDLLHGGGDMAIVETTADGSPTMYET